MWSHPVLWIKHREADKLKAVQTINMDMVALEGERDDAVARAERAEEEARAAQVCGGCAVATCATVWNTARVMTGVGACLGACGQSK